MLKNGLGQLLIQRAQTAERFVDLFTGTGFVAWYIAENVDKPVLAVDLQEYATTLAKAIICRTKILDPIALNKTWIQKAIDERNATSLWGEAARLIYNGADIKDWVEKSRKLCKKPSEIGPIWNAYGGHYFSPSQALTFDFLISHLPKDDPERFTCLAACISAATECVAAPGHTAQPFQPTITASPFILEAWSRDPIVYCQKALDMICPRHAQIAGNTITGDALVVAQKLNKHDLAFIDPPYSNVQYSRFYHVLETIARGQTQINVSGIGRYPPLKERPQSKFSNI
jgi:16S rRNA G966 N2-methylase RsmD